MDCKDLLDLNSGYLLLGYERPSDAVSDMKELGKRVVFFGNVEDLKILKYKENVVDFQAYIEGRMVLFADYTRLTYWSMYCLSSATRSLLSAIQRLREDTKKNLTHFIIYKVLS